MLLAIVPGTGSTPPEKASPVSMEKPQPANIVSIFFPRGGKKRGKSASSAVTNRGRSKILTGKLGTFQAGGAFRRGRPISGDVGSIELGVLGGKVKLVLGGGLASRVLRWKRSR